MIVSASRRTDIPAFFSNWFMERVEAGFVEVCNPYNSKQVKRVSLLPQDLDCIVFWTKNAMPMMDKLPVLISRQIPFYFLYTITPYNSIIEGAVPEIGQRIEAFLRLSEMIGSDKTIWRYDPIIITSEMSCDWHIENFRMIVQQVRNHTRKCIFSFVEPYRKCRKALHEIGFSNPDSSIKYKLIQELSNIAKDNTIELVSCSQTEEYSNINVSASSCIDPRLIETLAGKKIYSVKNKNGQRMNCQCAPSIDIGKYGTCLHNCIYCYAKP